MMRSILSDGADFYPRLGKVRPGTALLAGAAVFMAAIGPASAEGVPLERHFDGEHDACFGRIYTPEHLAAHPKQRVSELRFEHFPKVWGYLNEKGEVEFDRKNWSIAYRLTLRLRQSGQKLYETGGTCQPGEGRLNCYVDCDGGGFELVDGGEDSILLKPMEQGFAIFSCGEAGEEDLTANADAFAGMLTPGEDDKAFRLTRLPKDQCVPPPPPTE